MMQMNKNFSNTSKAAEDEDASEFIYAPQKGGPIAW